MFDYDEMFTSKTDESLPASPIHDRFHSEDGYHAVLPPYTGTFMPPKPDLVYYDSPNVNETNHTAFNVKLSPTKHDINLSHTHRPSAPIIEDWVSDSEDDSEVEIPQNATSFVQPTEQVKTPRPFVQTIETSILASNLQTTIPKPKSNGNSRNRKACFVSDSEEEDMPQVTKDVPSFAQTHSPSKGLRRTKKAYFVCKSESHLIKDCDFHARKLAQKSDASKDIHKHHAPINYSKFPLQKVSAAASSKSQAIHNRL
nr:hypothetical protein [Tanacetum cinerariifolium]